jgi:hypothetical protein
MKGDFRFVIERVGNQWNIQLQGSTALVIHTLTIGLVIMEICLGINTFKPHSTAPPEFSSGYPTQELPTEIREFRESAAPDPHSH